MLKKSALLEIIAGKNRGLLATPNDKQAILSAIALKLGQIYQSIRVKESKIYNIAELYGLPYLEGIVSVAARFEATSERRVQVKFERSILGLSRLIRYESPAKYINEIESGKKFAAVDFRLDTREQQGWLDVTYLDGDLRIGRGNEGSVFVLTKE
ncbi:MAG: fibrillin [Oscillatoriales cyanobacterium]|nr:MAG: fibrillin [Oscillatoriales cyanobacterium]